MDEKPTEYAIEQYVNEQRSVCKRYGASFVESPFDVSVGVAIETFGKSIKPINGLRHPQQGASVTNWYIWAGELSPSTDFFKPIHLWHLIDMCPEAIRFLGLAPGWRFLFDENYEDVWYDEKLLDI